MNLATLLPRPLQWSGQAAKPAQTTARATPVAAPERRAMPRHAIMTLENRRLQLRVVHGWVWITRDHCPADLVLGAGDVFEQQAGARVLVQALEDVALLIADAGGRAHNA